MTTLATRIEEIISSGFTQTELGRAAGVSKGTPTQWRNGNINSIKLEYAQGIEALTGFNANWIVTGRGPKKRSDDGHQYTGPERRNFDAPVGSFPVALSKFREVPVIGKTMGGIPERIWDDGGYPVGISDKFAEIATQDPNAFIVPIEGGSMVPRYNPGEYALVEPGTEPEIEDDVLVRFTNDGTCLKRLLSRRGGFIRLGSYNSQEVITAPVEEIGWMYYVAHPIPARKIRSRT